MRYPIKTTVESDYYLATSVPEPNTKSEELQPILDLSYSLRQPRVILSFILLTDV